MLKDLPHFVNSQEDLSLDKLIKRLEEIEKQLIDLRHQINMQTERAVDAFWDRIADEAEASVIDEAEKWR